MFFTPAPPGACAKVLFVASLSTLMLGAAAAPPPPSGGDRTVPSPRGGATVVGKRVESMTLGAKPPGMDGKSVTLFDGSGWAAWVDRKGAASEWPVQEDGAVRASGGDAVTKRSFGDFQLHLEFLCPEIKGATGQSKSNSGVYLQGRYELQVLDSYGLAPADNRCGGVYGKAAPLVNAALPPGYWQTYDIAFRAARLDPQGRVIEKPRVTVIQNGLLIHNNLELDAPTAGGLGEDTVASGPILLQFHGDPVLFRNIWVRSE